jgi:hypothetical protein
MEAIGLCRPQFTNAINGRGSGWENAAPYSKQRTYSTPNIRVTANEHNIAYTITRLESCGTLKE